jgi:hypothetical protein
VEQRQSPSLRLLYQALLFSWLVSGLTVETTRYK